MNTVLAIGGWDPTGGAGIVADAKAIHACGAYALTAVTGLAVQSTDEVLTVRPVAAALLSETLEKSFEGLKIGAVKTGMLGSPALGRIVFDFVRERDVPWVYDPVERASDGRALGRADKARAFPRNALSVVTPNQMELVRLTGASRPGDALVKLFAAGFDAVLLKGGHATGRRVTDELVMAGGSRFMHERRRVAGSLHGSGCTLAAALAAFLAVGAELPQAFYQAEMFLDAVFQAAWRPRGRRMLSVLPLGAPADAGLLH